MFCQLSKKVCRALCIPSKILQGDAVSKGHTQTLLHPVQVKRLRSLFSLWSTHHLPFTESQSHGRGGLAREGNEFESTFTIESQGSNKITQETTVILLQLCQGTGKNRFVVHNHYVDDKSFQTILKYMRSFWMFESCYVFISDGTVLCTTRDSLLTCGYAPANHQLESRVTKRLLGI
jgi:hypothetical protein